MCFLLLSLVPAQDPVISGPVPPAPTALDVNRLYNYTCTSSNGYLAANISWKLGTSLGNSIDVSPSVSGRTFRVSESTVTNSDSTLTKVSTLSLVPITDDHGKLLFCVTSQSTAPGATVQTITKSTSVSVFVQRRSPFIFFSLVPEVFLAPGMLREPAFSSTWCDAWFSLEKGIRDFSNFIAEIPVVQLLNTSYTVEVGQSVTLGCRILTALPSATNVYWSRFINNAYDRVAIDNVRYFGSTVGNPNLTITNVALSDATSYQCSATNTAGTGNSAMAMLIVTGSEYSKVFPLHVF